MCLKQRSLLTERLADLDDGLAELILERESLELLNSAEITSALRRVTLHGVC